LVFPIFAVILFSSCQSQKALGYAEDFNDTARVAVKYPEPLIRKSDILAILVYSEATDGGKADALFNLPFVPGAGATQPGYLVDNDGYIQHQRLGRMKAEGLTKPQLAEEVKKRLGTLLTNPSVTVSLLNFKVTMLGEVARAGPITIPTDKVTILEAVGLAGDVTIYGKKDEVVVLRETDGVVEHGQIDLSSKTLFESPYYFLRQNDVVLVNPNKNKARLSEQVFNQRLGIAFSLINMIALLYNIFSQ
ncbi:MAG TPA: polysaccharide biosynthesis/export family protein, partial [Chitinophagaceae bacterium]|nr:polysaccharide biosynthesis/export family protein [Chitinophagaceae bacterium]